MQVLHIHSGNLSGGVETLLRTLHRHEPLSHEFALCFEGRLSKELSSEGARVWQLGEARARYPHSVYRARNRLRDLLRQRRFDVVMTHMSWAHAIFAPAAKEDSRLPVVNWQHNPASGARWIDHWAKQTTPSLSIANSNFVKESLEWLFPSTRHEVLYCPVDLVEGRRHSAHSDQVVILQASRFDKSKGHDALLRALGRLRALPGWICLIAGAPQSAAEQRREHGWKKLAHDLGIAGRVEFLGFQSDMHGLLACSSIYCQPNRTPEAFGIAFIEALWNSVPVVSTAFGGALEVVTPDCGILTKPGDIGDLASALRLLITSPELRKKLGESGPRRAVHLCEPRRQVARLQGLLETVTGVSTTSALTA